MGIKLTTCNHFDIIARMKDLTMAQFISTTKYRAVYEKNRDVFRAWGYRTEDGGFVSLGDKEAFLAATKVYDKPFSHGARKYASDEFETDCVNADCADVAKKLIDGGYNPAVLNLASRHHACGGYDSGAGAQEESLCRVSTLSQSLYQHFDPSLRCVREAAGQCLSARHQLRRNLFTGRDVLPAWSDAGV